MGDRLVLEFYKEGGSLSYMSFDFRHVHDGIALTPKTSNAIGPLEMKILTMFCEQFGYGLCVYVAHGAKSPSVEINICKE